MLNQKTFLAVIPARGGSKRLPRKNILELAGKPLIGWSIEAALNSSYIDDIIVSSDDKEILSIAASYNVKTIFRPMELATDTATSFDVVKHAIKNADSYDYIVLLQPTSPLRTAEQIDEAIELLISKNADAIISVCEMDHSPLWSNTLPEDRSMENFIREETKNKRSQDLAAFFRLNGAIYICDNARLLENKSFFLPDNIFAYVMDQKSSIDIDNPLDFQIAQCIAAK